MHDQIKEKNRKQMYDQIKMNRKHMYDQIKKEKNSKQMYDQIKDVWSDKRRSND